MLPCVCSVIGTLCNHDDDDNENEICMFDDEKTIVLHALHEHSSLFSHFADVLVLSRREMTSFAVVWTT